MNRRLRLQPDRYIAYWLSASSWAHIHSLDGIHYEFFAFHFNCWPRLLPPMEVSYTVWFGFIVALVIISSTFVFCYIIFFYNRPNRKKERRTSALQILAQQKNCHPDRIGAFVRPQVPLVPPPGQRQEFPPKAATYSAFPVQPRRQKDFHWTNNEELDDECRLEPSAPPLPH